METLGTCMAEWIRRALARKLMRWALRVLPFQSFEYLALARALTEAREYDRYEGYTLLMREKPIPFPRWREEWRAMKMLRASKLEPRSKDRLYLVRSA